LFDSSLIQLRLPLLLTRCSPAVDSIKKVNPTHLFWVKRWKCCSHAECDVESSLGSDCRDSSRVSRTNTFMSNGNYFLSFCYLSVCFMATTTTSSLLSELDRCSSHLVVQILICSTLIHVKDFEHREILCFRLMKDLNYTWNRRDSRNFIIIMKAPYLHRILFRPETTACFVKKSNPFPSQSKSDLHSNSHASLAHKLWETRWPLVSTLL
jgi:hypothetical protein